ncbi:AlbA family DNA-binding domain-containing protein [Modestobacter sp. VKM Ac-2978]|uniref:AlbA family DNA-binding domain-containing protein n=1 Tax=Modestobacter sp. VKM Ac-2978 TaxID=3004132 RepID=UPI0022AB08DC|nr:ATP-binding protein [Modestobacter sp. VKM Ac-2978]MCZ2849810.1 ATP-binding protein [Modestobacter sp. VKM Ac-2978]
MIVVDGRTDREKLVELLQLPEQTHLEFKAELDLTSKQDELNFVKDAVSMANRPPGGYILIGVNDDGTLALTTGTIANRSLFDGARLGDLIRKYIEGEVHVVSQIHEIDGHEVVLIHFPDHRDGLPVPMSKLGQFAGQNGKPVLVFREGDVLVREGAKNTPLRHAHWNDLLSRRDQRLREETRAQVDSLIADLAAALRAGGSAGPALVPLTVEMADEAFVEGVTSYLEADSDIRLRQFLGQTAALVSNPKERSSALDKITILAVQAMYFERDAAAQAAIGRLFDSYVKLGQGDAVARLDVITRVYVLGSLAVRLRQWGLVRDLALRPYPPNGDGYVYSSWIRHGQVDASRAGLFPQGTGGLMISAARDLMRDRRAMRSDVPDSALLDRSDLAHDDALFNSLCQFDILYCLIVAAEGQHHGGGYPAASAMNQDRADPAFEVVAGDAAARRAMFPASSERGIAEAMAQVFASAEGESLGFGGHWWSLPPGAHRFVSKHLGESA